MKKEIRDGKVGVLYSPGYGAGWFTWNSCHDGGKDILYDPSIIYMVEEMQKNWGDANHVESWISNIVDYCKDKYPDVYTGGVDGLIVAWLPEGTEFYVDEYDGSETLVLKEDPIWLTA